MLLIKILYRKATQKSSSLLNQLFLLGLLHDEAVNMSPSIKYNFHRTNPMAANSPFSRFYRNLIQQSGPPQSSYNTPSSPLSVHPFQGGAINIFQAAFQTEGPESYDRSEPKIKVFGMGEKKKKKQQNKSQCPQPQPSNQQLRIKAQNSHNLLESLESLPEDYCHRISREAQEPERIDELQRLLDLSPDLPGASELQADSNFDHRGQDNDPSNNALRKSHYLQDPARQISSRIKLILGKTDSCEVAPERCERSAIQNNNSFSCKSMNSSKIRDIFDHCSDLFNNNETPNNPPFQQLAIQEEDKQRQKVEQSQIIQSDKKNQHLISLNVPVKNQRLQQLGASQRKKPAILSQQSESPSKKIVSSRPPIKTSQKQQKVTLLADKKSQQYNNRGIELKKYLSLDNHYSNQIDLMINRYQKMAQLKQKKKQIKEELGKLAPKPHAANRYDKHQYLSRYSNEPPLHRQEKAIYRQPALFSSAPPTKRPLTYSQDKDEKQVKEFEDPNQLQRQLSMNVQNMQRIINKFKILSKEIANQSQEFVSSQIVYQNTANSLDKGSIPREYLKAKIGHRQSLSNQSLAQQELNRQFFESVSSGKGLRHISSEVQPHMMPSQSMTDSIQQISLSKQLATIQQRTNPYLTNHKYNPTKNTTRTEKKGSSATRGTPNIGWQTYNRVEECQHHYHCECDHAYLAEQLSKINKKLQSLEKHQNPQLSHVRSEDNIKHKTVIVPQYQLRLDKNSIESDQKEDINQSIPPRENLQYQKVNQKNKQSFKHSSSKKKTNLNKRSSKESHKASPRYIQQQKKGVIQSQRGKLQLDDEIMKKMRINFPVIEKAPSRNDSLASLVSLGEYVFSILLKFVRSRGQVVPKKIKIDQNLRVKKSIDYVHYSFQDFQYHLIYSFTGKLYFGQWSQEIVSGNGYKQGFGYYYKPKKYVYEGYFYLDRKHGKGLLNSAKGQVYEGDWAKGKKEGYGILINAVGDVYKGFFQGGKKSGKGEEQLANGDYYRGQFRKGKLNGQGVYVWADGSIYKGGFKNALLNGRGVWRSKENDVYDGDYKDNKKHGKGTYTWSNGASFTGYFYEDQNTGERSHAATKEKKFLSKTPAKRQSAQREPGLLSKVKKREDDD